MVSVMGGVATTTCAGVPESVAVTVRVAFPTGPNGVPLITPVEGFNVKPAGKDDTCQVCAPVPPFAISVREYGTPTIPSGSAVVVISSGGIVDVIATVAVAVCGGVPESVTVNVTMAGTVVGDAIPLTTPVAALNVKPDGSVPEVCCQ